MQYKAVITDLDGTAVDSPDKKVVSERLAEAVRKLEAVGVKVCAATGRPESYAMPVLTSMHLTEPCIVAGGTRIIDPVNREKLWSCDLSRGDITEVVRAMEGFNYNCLWNDYVEEAYSEGGWSLNDFDSYEGTHFFEICYIPDGEVDEVLQALAHIEGIAATVVVAQRPGMRDVHVTNREATKEHAVGELQRMIGATKEQLIGVGDGHNDLHIFNAVGHKVAMGNAVPEVKAAADEMIGDIKEDGLATYFEKLAEEVR